MGVIIGGTHVTEAAYAKAKAGAETSKANTASDVLKELRQKFGDMNINSGAFGGSASYSSGLNNVTIAPNILQEMADDPEKRIEYEAILHDTQACWKDALSLRYPGGGRRVYQEYFIHSNGESGMMTISESGGGSEPISAIAMLPKNDRESWQERIMKSIEEKREKEKQEAQRLAEKMGCEAMLEAEDGHMNVTV